MIHLFWALFWAICGLQIKGSETKSKLNFILEVITLMAIKGVCLWLTAKNLHLYLIGLLQ